MKGYECSVSMKVGREQWSGFVTFVDDAKKIVSGVPESIDVRVSTRWENELLRVIFAEQDPAWMFSCHVLEGPRLPDGSWTREGRGRP